MIKFAPGQAVPRTEDRRLLTGQGRFASDVTLPGQAYAAIVRSPYPHAVIRGIDTSAAEAAPGVLAVLTGADWAADGMGGVVCRGHMLREPINRPDGRPFNNPDRPALPTDRARYLGEALAVVVADTPARAADAAELVILDLEPLPANTDTLRAADEGAPLVWDDCPRNEMFRYAAGDAAKTEAALAASPHMVRQRLVINRIHANPLEPRSVNGDHDAARGHLTIHGGAQRAFAFRDMLADHVFHMPREQLDLVPGDVGGSFGLKGSMVMEMPLMGWASRRVGRPVKWTATRGEMLTGDDHARDSVIDAEIAFDDTGQLLAFRARVTANMGAFIGYFGIAPAINNIGSMAGTYRIPAMDVCVTGVWTNTNPVSPYRGAGRPEAAYAIERMMDLAAAHLGLDPVEMRRRNLIPDDALPFRTALTFTYDCGEFGRVFDKALALADHAGFPARRAESAARGQLRGLGVAMSIEAAAGAGTENAELRFAADGSVDILAGTTNHGQGHETVYMQYVAHRLGLDPETIRVVEGDTREVRAGTGTGGSRSAAFASGAINDAIDRCIARGRPIAAHLLQADAAELRFADAVYRVGDTGRAMSFAEVARAAFRAEMLPAGMEAGLHEAGVVQLARPSFPNGCQVCEVEIDPQSGLVTVLAHTVVDDVGFEINPLIVEGQLHGGIVQGAGQALMEAVVYDEAGQNLTGSFMDYAMPRAGDFPLVAVDSHPVPTATNPAGAKGVGESGTVGGLAATMNAINHALAARGIAHIDMPATPQRVWRAIRAAEAAHHDMTLAHGTEIA